MIENNEIANVLLLHLKRSELVVLLSRLNNVDSSRLEFDLKDWNSAKIRRRLIFIASKMIENSADIYAFSKEKHAERKNKC